MNLYSKLDAFQKETLDSFGNLKTIALFGDAGTGKTWITAALMERRQPKKCLVICKLTNKESTWLKLLKQHFPTYTEDYPGTGVYLVHKDMVHGKFAKKLGQTDWDMIVWDESQDIKNRQSRVSRAAGRLGAACPQATKIILTGTPVEECPSDMWAQFRFLKPELLGNWETFEATFFAPPRINPDKHRRGSFGWHRAMRLMRMEKREFVKLDEFMGIIAPYCFHISDTVLNLPKLTIEKVPVVLRGEQRRLYDAMEEHLVARFSDEELMTGAMKITRNGKLHQICGGFVRDDAGTMRNVGRAKLRAMVQCAKKGSPVVVFCRYVEEVKAVAEALGPETEILYGKTPKNARTAIQERFQRGLIPALVCQIKTGGVGIDLFASSVGVLYSFGHSFIDFYQAIKRLYRRGQKRPVTLFLLYAVGTIDEDICDNIETKDGVTKSVFRRLHEVRSGKSVEGSRHPAGVRPRRVA